MLDIKLLYKSCLLFLLICVCPKLYAIQTDCLGIKKDNVSRYELKKSNNFFNCFYMADLPLGTDVRLIVTSPDGIINDIKQYYVSGGEGSLQRTVSSTGPGNNSLYVDGYTQNTRFSIKPKISVSNNKDLEIGYAILDGVAYVHVTVYEVAAPIPPVNIGGGWCDGPICYDPQSDGPGVSLFSVSSSCSDNEVPPELPQNFDLNKHLERVKTFADFANTFPSIYSRNIKLTFLVLNYGPYMMYDFKNARNSYYPITYEGSADFGNFFFAASAPLLGFNRTETLQLAAGAQIVQDLGDISLSASAGMMRDHLNGINVDNADDIPLLDRGRRYTINVYIPDSQKNSVKNSCSPEEEGKGYETGQAGTGTGGGWSAGLSFTLVGGSYGISTATPVTSITDLTAEDLQK